jgi:YD repeat-containing protein
LARANRVVVTHYAWNWDEVSSSTGAAWSEEWTYDAKGSLVSRRRIQAAKAPRQPTVSTDPRAGAIMREELGLAHRHGTPMSGPHHR